MKKEKRMETVYGTGTRRVHGTPGSRLQPAKGGRSSYGKQPEGGADVWRGFKGIFRGGRRKDGDTPDVELGKYGGGSYRQ